MTNGGYLAIIGAILALFILRECDHKSDRALIEKTIKSQENFFKTELKSYFAGKKIEVNDRKDVVQNEVASTDDIEAIKDLYPELKNIESLIKTELHSNIGGSYVYLPPDTIRIPFTPDGMIHKDTIAKYYIAKGSKVKHEELWYDLSISLEDSLIIDSFCRHFLERPIRSDDRRQLRHISPVK